MPSIGHLAQTTQGQSHGEHEVLESFVIGFRNEERYGTRLIEEVNQGGHHDGDGGNQPRTGSDQQALFTVQRKTSTVSWMHVSKSSHVMPSTFSALALE